MPRPSGDRRFFLRASREIERAKREGRRLQTPVFNLVSCPRLPSESGQASSRVGIVVGKRLGAAVTRNRAKRIFRELARQIRGQLAGGHDLLVFPRREALEISHAQLRSAWVSALSRAGLLTAESSEPCGNSASE
ncbi:MAG: ribonuclease P protein component [Nitrospirota bacterium]